MSPVTTACRLQGRPREVDALNEVFPDKLHTWPRAQDSCLTAVGMWAR